MQLSAVCRAFSCTARSAFSAARVRGMETSSPIPISTAAAHSAAAAHRFRSFTPPPPYTAKLWSPICSRTSRLHIQALVAVAGL